MRICEKLILTLNWIIRSIRRSTVLCLHMVYWNYMYNKLQNTESLTTSCYTIVSIITLYNGLFFTHQRQLVLQLVC